MANPLSPRQMAAIGLSGSMVAAMLGCIGTLAAESNGLLPAVEGQLENTHVVLFGNDGAVTLQTETALGNHFEVNSWRLGMSASNNPDGTRNVGYFHSFREGDLMGIYEYASQSYNEGRIFKWPTAKIEAWKR